MSRTSTRVVSVRPDQDNRTRSKPRSSRLYTAYKSVFGPSKSKLASIARFRSVIEGCDESLNGFIDRNIPDMGGHIAKILNLRNETYNMLSDVIRPTPEDIAAERAIRARIREYQRSQGSKFLIAEGRTRKRRKHRKHKKH